MKKFIVISIGMILSLMLVPNTFGQTCVPAGGSPNIGPTDTSFDFISNGLPSNDTCWDKQNVNFVTNTTDCGWTSNAFELAVSFSAGMSQSFTIPANDPRTHFSLTYLMDFDDPNHDDFDRVVILVWDNTSGRLLLSDAYRGSLPSFSCVRHELGTFNGSLAGHNITVQFQGSNGYANTHIRFRLIQFWGWS